MRARRGLAAAFLTFAFLFSQAGVQLAAPGTGTIGIAPSSVTAASTGNTLQVRYTAADAMAGGEIALQVPTGDGWTPPRLTSGPGQVTAATTGTFGAVLDPADDATLWAGSGITLSQDTTDRMEGVGALRAEIQQADMGDAITARYTSTTSNWAMYERAGFWVKSTTPLSAGQVLFFYTLNGASAPAETIDVAPSGVPANTWTYLSVGLSQSRATVKSWGWKLGSSLSSTTLRFDAFRFVLSDAEATTGWATSAAQLTLATDSAVRAEGSGSLRVDVAGTASAGARVYTNLATAQDWRTSGQVSFWIRATTSTTSGQLVFAYSASANLPNTSGTKMLYVPALMANQWTYVTLSFAESAVRTGVASYGFIYADDSFGTASGSFFVDGLGLRPDPLDNLSSGVGISPAYTVSSSGATVFALSGGQMEGNGSIRASLPASVPAGMRFLRPLAIPENWEAYTTLGVWVRASDATASSSLALFYASDAAGTSIIESFSLPSLTADQWTFSVVSLGAARGSVRAWGIRASAAATSSSPWTVDVDEALLGPAPLTLAGDTVSTRVLELSAAGTIDVTYADATAPALAAPSMFVVQTRNRPDESLTVVSGGTSTVTISAAPTALPTSTATPVPTATSTPLPTATPTLTATPTNLPTDTPVPTLTPTPLPTATPTPQPTETPTPRPTSTPEPIATPTPRPTETLTPTSTAAPTETPLPATATPAPPPTSTASAPAVPAAVDTTAPPRDNAPEPTRAPLAAPAPTPTPLASEPSPTAQDVSRLSSPPLLLTGEGRTSPIEPAPPAPVIPIPVEAPPAGIPPFQVATPSPVQAPDGVVIAVPSPVPSATPEQVRTRLIRQDGGVFVTADASLLIAVPAGALPDWAIIVHNQNIVTSPPEPPPGQTLAFRIAQAVAVDLQGASPQLREPATVVLQYQDEELLANRLDENRLTVQLLDPLTQQWQSVPARIDPWTNRVVVYTTVIGPIAVFAPPIPPDERPPLRSRVPF